MNRHSTHDASERAQEHRANSLTPPRTAGDGLIMKTVRCSTQLALCCVSPGSLLDRLEALPGRTQRAIVWRPPSGGLAARPPASQGSQHGTRSEALSPRTATPVVVASGTRTSRRMMTAAAHRRPARARVVHLCRRLRRPAPPPQLSPLTPQTSRSEPLRPAGVLSAGKYCRHGRDTLQACHEMRAVAPLIWSQSASPHRRSAARREPDP